MRSIWSGSLSFGLVSIDIKLYTAVREHIIGFKLLHKTCKHPISYKRWCSYCKKEVGLEDIVKGLELSKNSYFILSEENVKKLKLAKTDTIDIVEFVEQDLIDPIYYDRHYYALPAKADKAFFLFKKALELAGKVALGTFVMRDREHLCAISSYKDLLLISILNYAYEIVPIENLPSIKEAGKLTEAELKLAKELIDQLTKKKFDISEFKDTFAVNLREMLKTGKKITAAKRKAIEPAKEATLINALKASLGKPKKEKKPALRAKSKK